MTRVRIAPSPTGFAHVGTAYTALFNFAFAKKEGGTFIVRIEDTDTKRHVKDAEKAIFEGLSWLGIKHQESVKKPGKFGPYRQSEKLEVYRKKAEELVKKGLAYKDEGAIRFKNPGKDVSWDDKVRGEITFPGGEITDFVILKSDGYPTYNFAVTIDDLAMKITHVIRGEEHVSNTPRQLALYIAFKETPPIFAHHSTLRNKKKQKLSKRRDPVDLRLYMEKGYLPEALTNYLCLLGWSHPKEKEIFDTDEFVKEFSLERIRKSGPIFDTDKLNWINGEYIRKMEDGDLVEQIDKFYKGKFELKKLTKIIPLIKDRIKLLSEFEDLASFFFESPKVDKKLLGEDSKKHLNVAKEVLESVDFEKQKIDEALLKKVKENEFHTGKFFMDLRIAITGNKQTPPINDSIIILGKEETLKRIKNVL